MPSGAARAGWELLKTNSVAVGLMVACREEANLPSTREARTVRSSSLHLHYSQA